MDYSAIFANLCSRLNLKKIIDAMYKGNNCFT